MIVRRWNPITSQRVPPNLPLDPSGIVGVTRYFSWIVCNTRISGVETSRMVVQLGHTALSACPNPRSSTAAPQLGQFSAFAFTTGGATKGDAMLAAYTHPSNCRTFFSCKSRGG